MIYVVIEQSVAGESRLDAAFHSEEQAQRMANAMNALFSELDHQVRAVQVYRDACSATRAFTAPRSEG